MSWTPNFSIEWKNLSYRISERQVKHGAPLSVKIKKEEKIILHPQSGSISSGTLTALMGPSGAGKSTLLNCLAGKIDDWKGTIDLFTNGYQEEEIKLNLALVPQKDYLFDQLTVRETLLFAWRFKKLSKEGVKLGALKSDLEVIEETASDLNLITCLDTKVSNLSGGQMKRLSVGVELVSPPDVLILDEPTTGLDSTNALMIIQVIKRLLDRDAKSRDAKSGDAKSGDAKSRDAKSRDAENSIAIICSIHQPSFECLSLFDQIYLLSSRGEKIFFNPPLSVPSFLKTKDINVSTYQNPADHLLKLCYDSCNDADINDNIEMKSFDKLSYRNSTRKSITSNESVSLTNANEFDYKISLRDATRNVRKSFDTKRIFSYIWLLYQRSFKVTVSYSESVSRIIFCLITVSNLFVYNHKLGSHDGCWNSILDDDPSKNKTIHDLISSFRSNDQKPDYIRNMELVFDNITAISISNILIIHFHALLTGSVIPIEAKIVQKEMYNNWYPINAYMIARITFGIPFMVIQVILFTVMRFLTSFQPLEWDRFLVFCGAILFLAWCSEMIGIAFGALFRGNLVSGVIWTILYTFPIIVFGGYFVRKSSATGIVYWFMWASQLKHSFEASIIAVYGLGRCSSQDGTAISVDEITAPRKMMERAILDFDITHYDAKFIAPILGIPDDYCVAEVINGTRDYLGLNYFEDEFDDSGDTFQENPETYSYPMTIFKLADSDLYRCFYSLFVIFIVYTLIAIICTKRLIRR